VRAGGAVVVLKWDGERKDLPYTVVLTHHNANFVWRQDTDDMAAGLRRALQEYAASSNGWTTEPG